MRVSIGRRGGTSAVMAGLAALFVSATAPAAETPVERGAYLVNSMGACGNCHTPRDAALNPIATQALSGGFAFVDPGIGSVVIPNITPDKETGIGNLTAVQIVAELRNGKRPDGTLIGPPMPIPVYQKLSDGDAAAITAYLLSLKPVRHTVGRNEYMIPLPPDYGPPVMHVDEPSRSDNVVYGSYLATFAHCVLCHTPPAKDGPIDMSRAFAGGRELPDFRKPDAVTVSRNITSDPEDGIGKWSDAQIKRAIVDGIRPDGTRLAVTMPFAWYKRITPADLGAIVAFIRTIPPAR